MALMMLMLFTTPNALRVSSLPAENQGHNRQCTQNPASRCNFFEICSKDEFRCWLRTTTFAEPEKTKESTKRKNKQNKTKQNMLGMKSPQAVDSLLSSLVSLFSEQKDDDDEQMEMNSHFLTDQTSWPQHNNNVSRRGAPLQLRP